MVLPPRLLVLISKREKMGFPTWLFVLISACVITCYLKSVSGETRCIEREREALLKLKEGFTDKDGSMLSTWGSEGDKRECCQWEHVVCDNITGQVTALQLGGGYRFLTEDDYYSYKLGGMISSALLELHHLNHLDLRSNDFGGTRIPEFIGSIAALQLLDLSYSNFSGVVPPQLGNLTQLHTLDLGGNPGIRSGNLYWLSHLSSLSHLNLDHMNTSEDANWLWLHHVLSLPSLHTLSMASCGITDFTFDRGLSHVNSSTSSLISSINLSSNNLTSSTTLQWLFLNTSASLAHIDLSGNQFSGPIPDAFEKLVFLETLDLRDNMFEGRIPKSLGNLSLVDLDLSHNAMGGPLEELFAPACSKLMASLYFLHLSHNNFTGSVLNIRKFPALTQLFLNNNKLTTIGTPTVGLSKLQYLDVSHNSLQGTVSETYFIGLSSLRYLYLSFNRLKLEFSKNWIPSFKLSVIDLANCKIGPSFPEWLQTQRGYVDNLDISNAGISDEAPQWLWNMSLRSLNLSHNQITGTIPDLSSTSIRIVDASNNNLSGTVPSIGPLIWIFQLSQNMFSGTIASLCRYAYCRISWLDLSNNQLTGTLPSDFRNMNALEILNVNYNNLSGEIHSLGSLSKLKTLHLRANGFFGELPSTLQGCPLLQQIDIGGNKLTGAIPPWLGEKYTDLAFLSLRQNRFYGGIPPEICDLTQIQVLDLSRNNLIGKIPECFDRFTALVDKNKTTTTRIYVPIVATEGYIDYGFVQWKGQESMYTNTLGLLKLIDLSSNRLIGSIPESFSRLKGLISLNLSRNSLTGRIIRGIGNMDMLEAVDLSRNQLSGEIPLGLGQLHFLAVLVLVNNNLTGEIPPTPTLQGFDPSFYAGNVGLCGLPLLLCPQDSLAPSSHNNNEETDDGLSFMQDFAISMAFGFIFGFWAVVGPLLLKRSWRIAFFNFWNVVGDWLYVTIAVFFKNITRGR
ncbi:unnamed protein product [Cuscuta europaea]|uniref:Leucine-rich repeat-containing N-terminal plant-type domain-containing protein n=1 Tax=Cuscuta europaea TaxID=41803 RepID=A0A9P1E2W8_CUSEU|nr:unnamed protein product [Cuscuta europaea]